jgi:hypothetical protein
VRFRIHALPATFGGRFSICDKVTGFVIGDVTVIRWQT